MHSYRTTTKTEGGAGTPLAYPYEAIHIIIMLIALVNYLMSGCYFLTSIFNYSSWLILLYKYTGNKNTSGQMDLHINSPNTMLTTYSGPMVLQAVAGY